jgi:hypothetical protein
VPLDDLGIPHQCLELSDGQLVQLLALLLGHLLLRIFVFAGDLVVLVKEDLALVARVRFLGALLLVQAQAELLEDALVCRKCRVVFGKEVVVDGAIGIDLVGRVGVLLDFEVGRFALAVDGCLVLWRLLLGLGFLGAVLPHSQPDATTNKLSNGTNLAVDLGLLLLLLLGPAHLVLGHLWRRHLGCCEPTAQDLDMDLGVWCIRDGPCPNWGCERWVSGCR